MLFTRQREAEATAATVVAAGGGRALSSSVLIDRCSGEHGELSTLPPTRKLRSLTTRTSCFNANGASVAARVAAPIVAPIVSMPVTTPRADPTSVVPAPNLVLKKSSRFRGVTKHHMTARFEAHLWDKDAFNAKQKKKGRQVYLGAYDDKVSVAKAYDLAALKYWGSIAVTNFKVENYTQQLKEMKGMSRLEFLAGLRRKSNGFSRGLSKFRGVARHHRNGRWEARIGRVEGNKYLYLGTFGTQEEAAEAYDKAAIKYRGTTAITNFELSCYQEEIEAVQGPKNNASKKSFKDNQISKTHGHLPISSQTTENTTQSSGGGENLSTTNTMNLHLGTNFGAVSIGHSSSTQVIEGLFST